MGRRGRPGGRGGGRARALSARGHGLSQWASHSAAAGRRRGMRRFVREVKACRTYVLVVQPAVRT
jgi:hypothetical protein